MKFKHFFNYYHSSERLSNQIKQPFFPSLNPNIEIESQTVTGYVKAGWPGSSGKLLLACIPTFCLQDPSATHISGRNSILTMYIKQRDHTQTENKNFQPVFKLPDQLRTVVNLTQYKFNVAYLSSPSSQLSWRATKEIETKKRI